MSSVNFRVHDIFARKKRENMMKNYQNSRIFMIFVRKINKIPEFYMTFPKIYEYPRTLMIFVRKINKFPEYYMIFREKLS